MKNVFIVAVLLIFSVITDAQWTQIGSDIDGETAEDQSGLSVAVNADGSIVAIGAPMNPDNGYGSGHVRVFESHFSEISAFENNKIAIHPNLTSGCIKIDYSDNDIDML